MNIEQARFNMIEQQIRPWEVLDQKVLDLLFVVKREDFAPPAYRNLAFADLEIPLGSGQVMLAPLTEAGSAEVREKEKVYLNAIIAKVNELFEGELSDDDKLVYVNNVLKTKLMESDILRQQAASNSKEQFANSPDLNSELMNAIMDALMAHTSMSKQALDSEKVRNGLKDILLGPAQLYEALKAMGGTAQVL